MTSPSSNKISSDSIEKLTVDALDKSIGNLPEEQELDLAKARILALKQYKQTKDKPIMRFFSLFSVKKFATIAIPVAASAVIAFNINQAPIISVPEIPVALVHDEIPVEDLVMLENLEFLAWLAENETNNLL